MSKISIRMQIAATLLVAVCWSLFALETAEAGSWPQILGPTRNGVADSESLPDGWAEQGPRLLWEHAVGAGYAGPAVTGDRAIVFHRQGDQLQVEALSVATGRPIWKRGYGTRYASSIDPDSGPRCVPLVAGGRVFTLGPDGVLQCLSLDDGERLWRRSLREDFSASTGYFGVGSSPILAAERLLVNAGGRDGAGIVAFDPATGETIWKSTDEGASYSSPVEATVGGKRQVIFVTRLNCVAVDPQSGDVLFRFPFGKRGPTVNGANPVVAGDRLFLSASYGVGALVADLGAKEPRALWSRDDVMSSQYSTSVADGRWLYGIDGRADLGATSLRCVEMETGRIVWQEDDFGMGTLILTDKKLLIQKTDGRLVLARATPKGYEQLDTAKLTDRPTRALPALCDGRYFLRDAARLRCYEVGR